MAIKDQLIEFQNRFDSIDPPPATMLEILGEAGRERSWEVLLAYFLDPGQPHGLGTDILEQFVRTVSSKPTSNLPVNVPLENVTVTTQATTDRGPVDLLLWAEDSWFICVEMKVHAGESGDQCERYLQAPRIGELIKSDHNGVAEYVYLAPEYASPPSSDQFREVSWSELTAQIDARLHSDAETYPDASIAQLTDFVKTIKRELRMNDFDRLSEEAQLYAEYADTIKTVQESHKREWKELYKRLDEALHIEFEGEGGEWDSYTHQRSFHKFFRPEWQGFGEGTRIEYEPHIHLAKPDPDIRLRLDVEADNKDAIRGDLRERIDEEVIQELGWTITNDTWEFIGKTISLDFNNPDDALQRAAKGIRQLHAEIGSEIDGVVVEWDEA